MHAQLYINQAAGLDQRPLTRREIVRRWVGGLSGIKEECKHNMGSGAHRNPTQAIAFQCFLCRCFSKAFCEVQRGSCYELLQLCLGMPRPITGTARHSALTRPESQAVSEICSEDSLAGTTWNNSTIEAKCRSESNLLLPKGKFAGAACRCSGFQRLCQLLSPFDRRCDVNVFSSRRCAAIVRFVASQRVRRPGRN